MTDIESAVRWYRRFHGRTPGRVLRFRRPAWYRGPSTLVVLGRVSEIGYEPFDSEKDGTNYIHEFGDYGSRRTQEKPLLATDPEGRDLFIIKQGSKFRVSSARGIVG